MKASTQRRRGAKVQSVQVPLVIELRPDDGKSFPFLHEEMGQGFFGEVKIRFARSMANDALYFWVADQRFTLPMGPFVEQVFKGLEKEGFFPVRLKLTAKGKKYLRRSAEAPLQN